jgi:hypothetical protein
MNYPVTREEIRDLPADRERIADLLEQYPRVSEDEVLEILTFLRTARHLDVGLLTSNDKIRPKLDGFMEDHKSHFRVKIGESAVVIGAIIGLLVIAWLVWEAFR